MENLRDKVLAYAEDVTHNLEQLRVTDTTGDTSESNKEVILYSGNNPKALLHPGKGNKNLPQTLQTPADEIQAHRVIEEISASLEECKASTPQDIDLEANRYMEFKIKMINPNQRPVRQKARQLPQAIREEVQKAITEQLTAGLIRHSTSEWAAPLQIVKKGDGGIRITVDYSQLNELIEFDPYPMPAAHRIYSELADAKYYSKFDFYKAYHQIPTEMESIKYTAFICEFGHYEYPSMPMGIKTAAAWFQRCMDITFAKLIQRNSLKCFLDDMVLYTRTLAEHLNEARILVEIMKEATLRVSLKKCELVRQEITFLGKVVSLGHLRNCPSKAICILEMPLPTTLGRLQAALGVFNYQRDFIPMFADLSEPIYRLLEIQDVPKQFIRKNGTIHPKYTLPWTEEQITSFEILKKETGKALELHQPDFNADFHLETDASERAYGGKLYQIQQGIDCALGYHSKTYTAAQTKYSAGEKELLAIVNSIEHFHYFLYGRHFRVYSDHMPLTFLLKKSNPSKRLERWIEKLSAYSFTIFYKPGKENVVADALSRMYDDEENIPIAPSDEDYHDMVIAAIDEEDTINLEKKSVIAVINPASLDRYGALRENQQLDPDIAWMTNLILTHGESLPVEIKPDSPIRRALYRQFKSLRIVNGILVKEREDELGNTTHLYVLPAAEVTDVLNKLHSSVFGAHLGRKKTRRKLLERFYRPYLVEKMEEYIRTCDTCQKIKTLVQKTRAEMMVLKPTHTNHIIASDFAGPFNRTPRGNKYLQVISDLYTKYMMVIPQPNKETITAAKTLVDRWCCTFGIPDICLTDGGKEYQSKLWDATCELLDIERSKTTPFHPECDGQSERLVRTSKQTIAAYVNELQDDWDTALPEFAYAYNSSVHGTTGVTPFEAMFGRRPKLPIDLIYPNVNINSPPASLTTDLNIENLEEFTPKLQPEVREYVDGLRSKLASICKTLEKSRDTKMNKAKWLHDRKIKRASYTIGDKVLVNHPKLISGQKQGIAYKYHGPYTVVGVNTNGCNYTIRKDKKGSRSKQVHKNNLKAYYERGHDLGTEPKYKDQSTATTLKCKCKDIEQQKIAKNNNQTTSGDADSESDTISKDKINSPTGKHVNKKASTSQNLKPKRKYVKRIIPPRPTTSRSGRILKQTNKNVSRIP